MGGEEPYIGMLLLVGFGFAPVGWAPCDGRLLPISENQTLFELIGTTYGGDGATTFALPDLRGRVPVHQGNGYVLGQRAGVETVTLTQSQYPAHTHRLSAHSAAENAAIPQNHVLSGGAAVYTTAAPNGQMAPATLGPSCGGNLPHDNCQPYLALNWIISLNGIYPAEN